MRIRTRCRTIDELVSVFARYVEGTALFVAMLETRTVNEESDFTVVLADGTTALRGHCVVREAWATADNRFLLPGMLLGIRMLTVRSKPVFDRMRVRAGRQTAKTVPSPQAAPPVAEISKPIETGTEVRPLVPRRLMSTLQPLPENAGTAAVSPPSPSPSSVVVPADASGATPHAIATPERRTPPPERADVSSSDKPPPGRWHRTHRTTEITKPLPIVGAPLVTEKTVPAATDGERVGAPEDMVYPRLRHDETTQPYPQPPPALRSAPTVSPVADAITGEWESTRRRGRGRLLLWTVALLVFAAAYFVATHEELQAAIMEPLPQTTLPPQRPRVESTPVRTIVQLYGRSYTVDVILTPVPVRTTSPAD